MSDMISRDAVLAEIAKEGLHILDAAIRALPATDARAEALKEAVEAMYKVCRKDPMPSVGRIEAAILALIGGAE